MLITILHQLLSERCQESDEFPGHHDGVRARRWCARVSLASDGASPWAERLRARLAGR